MSAWLSLKMTILVIIIYVALCFSGGGLMMYLESKAVTSNSASKTNLTRIKLYIQQELNVSINETQAKDIAIFASQFYETSETSTTTRSVDSLLGWRYFCEITLSTIGYGDMVPKTDAGKIFTIFFAAIGIPVHLMMIASIGCALSDQVCRLRYLFKKYIMKKDEMPKNDAITYIIIGIMLLIWLVLGGLAASKTQDWSYVNGFYFAFVTLTTIGYGDLTVDPKKGGFSGELVGIYTTIGLVLAAGVTDAVVKAIGSKAFKDETGKEKQNECEKSNRSFAAENKVDVSKDEIHLREIGS